MKKSTWVIVVVVVIVLIGGGILLAKNNKSDNTGDMSNMNMNGSSNSNSNSGGSNAVATTSVSIADMKFSPADISVKVGDTVTWTNKDSIAHTVTETDGQTGPNSGTVEPGKSYVFTFDHAGTYKYGCSIHPSMTGTVTVTAR